MDHAIAVRNLRKTYGRTVAADDVSFEVAKGEIFGIIGPNGSGKTTSVECVQGLRRPDSGSISVLGLDPHTQGRELRKRIGSQLQDSALPERLRSWEALDLFAAAAPGPTDWRRLEREWGLEAQQDTAFSNLSGGQRQRLLVALALINNPEVVFLDEMTTGLDPAARRVARSLISAVRERGATVLLVTHFMDEVERLCDRVAVFRGGRVVAVDTPPGLVTQFGGDRVVRFTSAEANQAWFDGVTGVHSVSSRGCQFEVHGEGAVLANVAAALMAHAVAPEDLRVEMPSLEDVYMRLAGEGLELAGPQT